VEELHRQGWVLAAGNSIAEQRTDPLVDFWVQQMPTNAMDLVRNPSPEAARAFLECHGFDPDGHGLSIFRTPTSLPIITIRNAAGDTVARFQDERYVAETDPLSRQASWPQHGEIGLYVQDDEPEPQLTPLGEIAYGNDTGGCWADVWSDEGESYGQCGKSHDPESEIGLCTEHLVKMREVSDE
jgi:hypothetical protein